MAISDISLEPLLNRSTDGLGSGQRLAVRVVNSVGVGSNRAVVAVTSTAQEITIGTSKATIEVFNEGASLIYYGGSTVSSATGIPIFPNETKTFANVKDEFSIYLVTAVGETANARIVEFT